MLVHLNKELFNFVQFTSPQIKWAECKPHKKRPV